MLPSMLPSAVPSDPSDEDTVILGCLVGGAMSSSAILKFVLLSCLNERLFYLLFLFGQLILKNYVGDLLLANWFFDNILYSSD